VTVAPATWDWAAVATRTLLLTAVYQASGAGLFLVLFGVQAPRLRRLGRVAAAIAVMLALLQLPLTAARMSGEAAGSIDGALLRLAWQSSFGTALAAQLAGLGMLLIGLRALPTHGRTSRMIAWERIGLLGGALLAAAAPTLTGHTSVQAPRALLAPLLALHLVVGAFWLGALWPLRWSVAEYSPAAAASLLQQFSRLAGLLVPLIAVAGVGVAVLLIHDVAVLRRPYGLLLLAKAGLFVLLMMLAARNRWRHTPALTRTPAQAAPALLRSIATEYWLLLGVLAVTATLTTLFSPED